MSYWTKRQEQLNKAAEKEEAAIKKRLASYYEAELKRLENEIAAYFQKYGADNVIEYRQLMQSLDAADITLLMEHMDEFAAKYPQYAHLMPVRESIYKLDRLQGLQYSINIAQANIAGYTQEQLAAYETTLAHKGLNYAMEALGFGSSFYAINSAIVKSFVDIPWCNGENFSTRIWNDTKKVADYIKRDMAQAFARGDSYDRIVRDMKRRFGVNRSNAYRLVYTEGTYVMAESSIRPFEKDFTEYKYSAVMDGKTCSICAALNDKIFLISERQPGVNFPPMHPWCRCSWIPYVADWDEWADSYKARHSTTEAQTSKIKGNLGLNVENAAESDIIKNIDIDDMKAIAYGKNIDENVIKVIYDTIKPFENRGDFYISEIAIKSIPRDKTGIPALQIEPIPSGRLAMLRLNINSDIFAGRTLDEINNMFFNSQKTVCNDLKDAVIHEAGHAKLIKGKSIDAIKSLYAELGKLKIDGISNIAKTDGAEALAEIEVLISRGEMISDREAKKLYKKFIGDIK